MAVIAKAGWTRDDVKRYCFEEEQQVEIPLTHAGRLRDFLFTPEPVARADFFVNCPKFKSHPWTTVTFSMKNYIGIQDDRHRLIDLYRTRFGDHIPLIRRQDIKGFVNRKPVWLIRPLPLDIVRRQAASHDPCAGRSVLCEPADRARRAGAVRAQRARRVRVRLGARPVRADAGRRDERQPGYQRRLGQNIVLKKGDEMGRFLLGSTVVLLFPHGPLNFNPAWTPACPVRLGEAMADAPSSA